MAIRASVSHLDVEQWIGISIDESQRIKTTPDKWITHRWPLCELNMTRADCLKWFDDMGYATPPRSACIVCPHRTNEEWRWMRDNEPEDWGHAVRFDQSIRVGLQGVKGKAYLHRSLRPLDEAINDNHQGELFGLLNECDGLCGV